MGNPATPARDPVPVGRRAADPPSLAPRRATQFRFRPVLFDALKGYKLSDLVHDLTAGFVVAAVAIPLAIAFAIASLPSTTDVPAPANAPQIGLVTVIVAGLVAALFGGSRYLIAGPTGAFVVIIADIVTEHGLGGLLVATFLAGAMLFLAGAFRLGQVIKFVPYPVTTGFTAGIAVIIFVGQLPELFGITFPAGTQAPAEATTRAWQTLRLVIKGSGTWAAFGIALGTIVVIQGFKRFFPRVPGPIVALVLFTAMAWSFGPDLLPGVVTVGDKYAIPDSLPTPSIPEGLLSWAIVKEMLPSAFTIFFLGALESLLTAVVADGMTSADAARAGGGRKRHDSNQELMGQGLANMASPLFGGIAATGAIARTATNIQNGARTPLASVIHVGVVAVVLLSLSGMAAMVPMACLAGILAVVAWNMSERHHFRKILKMPREDAAVLLATFFITIFVDLTWAVAVGLFLAASIFIHRISGLTRVAKVDLLDETSRSTPLFKSEDVPEDVLVYSVDGPFFFGAAHQFQEAIANVTAPPKVAILRMRDVPYVDATGLHALESAIRGLQRWGTRVMLSAVQPQPLDMLERSDVMRVLGDENLFQDTPDALAAARRHLASGRE